MSKNKQKIKKLEDTVFELKIWQESIQTKIIDLEHKLFALESYYKLKYQFDKNDEGFYKEISTNK